MAKARVLIVDDHPVVRRGLRQILSDTPQVGELAEASSGEEVGSLLGKGRFDLLLLDISLPGKSGLEVLEEVRRDFPAVKVLVVSVYPEEHYARRVLRLGGRGYLTKDSAPEELVKAVGVILRGGRYVTASLAQHLALSQEEGEAPHERLSEREFHVFLSLARGDSVGEIANRLSLSEKTVSTYRTRLLEKMGLCNNADLVRYAVKAGLVE